MLHETITRRGFALLFIANLAACSTGAFGQEPKPAGGPEKSAPRRSASAGELTTPQTAVFAAGCFWCVESDFERAPGVLEIVSGYTGGRNKNPNYKTYSGGGHREAVLVTYDPQEITYAGLVEYLIKHCNPIDKGGSFVDRGLGYTAAIYYENEDEKKAAEAVIKKFDAMKVFRTAITVPVIKRSTFYPAEGYHQDYHTKNPGGYADYRATCGRDEYIIKLWGAKADVLSFPGSFPPIALESVSEKEAEKALALLKPWASFKKPAEASLKKKLSKIEFQVTQEEATEKPFESPLNKEKGEGIYVDIVSGEPLFSSRDKVEAKDGWPSFSRPIVSGAILAYRVGTRMETYIEVRSPRAESHLGRLFVADPTAIEQTEKRFTINGAALRFISLDKMAEEGYGEFLPLLKAAAKEEG